MIDLRPLIKGALTYVPGLYDPRRFDSTGVNTAKYCYAVWLRHLVTISRLRSCSEINTVAELGPGASLGVAFAAILTGVEKVYALDVIPYATPGENARLFKGLVDLVACRAAIPDDDEFPGLFPKLDDYRFPEEILTPHRMAVATSSARWKMLADAVQSAATPDVHPWVEYRCPWQDEAVVCADSVDMVLSQAVLEHVDNLPQAHRAVTKWLKPGGIASHVVDLRSHRLASSWDGHLQYSPLVWKIVRGRRPYLINRVSPTRHSEFAHEAGLATLFENRYTTTPVLARARMHGDFMTWTDRDRETSTMHIVLQKPTEATKAT